MSHRIVRLSNILPRKQLLIALGVLLATLLTACVMPQPITPPDRDTLFQTSTLSALQDGEFDGKLTIGELRRHGDFGLGTFNALDGELIELDGQVYQGKDDGIAYLAEDSVQTPFAAVTFFDADATLLLDEAMTCADFQAYLDSQLPSLDAPYAIKVRGDFARLQVRAPQREVQPYPTLTEALADQVIFDSEDVAGTLVGFRLPDYMAGINAIGYHFHFISDDGLSGGHVLDCQTSNVKVEIDTIDRLQVDGILQGTTNTLTTEATSPTHTPAP